MKIMEFRAKNGETYTICIRMLCSFAAYKRGKLVLGHPDLKMMLNQIREGMA